MMQNSNSGQSLAKKGIYSAKIDTTILKKAMTEYCQYLDVRFQNLLQTLQDLGVPLQRRGDSFFADALYHSRHETGRFVSSCDVFTKQDISDMLDIAEATLRPGGHGFFFLPYYSRTGSAPCKGVWKGYRPLMTKMNMQSEIRIVLNLRKMSSLTSGIPEMMCNINQNELYTISRWPSMPYIS